MALTKQYGKTVDLVVNPTNSNDAVLTIQVDIGQSTTINLTDLVDSSTGATSLNTPDTIVKRDSSGDFSAGTITASLSGNATTASSATSFSGSLVGDVTGTQGATVVSSVGGSAAADVHSAELLANAAVSTNTASTIVKRDSSGNFSAGTITASLTGNATSATTATTATNATNAATTATNTTNATFFPTFVASSSSGNQGLDTATGLTFNPSTNTLTTTTFSGALSGNATSATSATTATNATNVATTATSTNASFFPLFVSSSSNGNQAADLDADLTYNPSTNTLTVGTLSGAHAASDLTGTVSIAHGGTNSGTTLNNNRIMQSSSSAIVEAAAITAAMALISDSNGIPTHSTVTSTELGYVSGVTSGIQTQINNINNGSANPPILKLYMHFRNFQ